MRWIAVLAVALLLPAPASAEDTCPYLPAFKALREKLKAQSAIEAVATIEAYAATNENPEGCELAEIDRLLAEREKTLFHLRAEKQDLLAQVVLRCNEFDRRTGMCQGPMMDATAHPHSQAISPLAVVTETLSLVSDMGTARLVGVYRISLKDALDGKAATHIRLTKGRFTLPGKGKDQVLMAIYQTAGPWRFRKAIWYFRNPG